MQEKNYRRTDQLMDRPTDTPSYRDAWTHLKTWPIVEKSVLSFCRFLVRQIDVWKISSIQNQKLSKLSTHTWAPIRTHRQTDAHIVINLHTGIHKSMYKKIVHKANGSIYTIRLRGSSHALTRTQTYLHIHRHMHTHKNAQIHLRTQVHINTLIRTYLQVQLRLNII